MTKDNTNTIAIIPALKYVRGVFLFLFTLFYTTLYTLYKNTHDRITLKLYTVLYDLLTQRAEAIISIVTTDTTDTQYQQQIDEYITYATDKLEDFIYRFTPKVLFLVGSYTIFYLLLWFMGVSFSVGLTTTLQSIHNTSYEFLTLTLHIVFTVGLVVQLLTASILFFSTISVVIHHIVGDIVSYTLTIATTKVNVGANVGVSGGVSGGVNVGDNVGVNNTWVTTTGSIIETLANTFTLTTNSTPQLIVGYRNDQWISISWKENNGGLVAGQSGSGKSQTAAFYLIQYALQGVKLILCDYDSPDGDEETLSERVSFLQESFYLPPAKTTEEIVARLRSLSKEYELRKKDPTRRFPLLFVIDEVSAFFQSLDDGDYGYSPSSFARELLLFRKVGIRAMIIGQEWSSNFSKSAREALRPIRSAFRVKILHKIDGANAKMLLDASDQKSARVLSEMKTGQIYYNKEILNIPLLTKEDAKYSSERLHSTIRYNEKIYQDRIYQAASTTLTPTPTTNLTPTKTSGGEIVLLNSLLNIQE